MTPLKRLPALVLAGIVLASAGCSDTPPKVAEPPPPGVTVSKPLVIDDIEYDEYSGYIRGIQETEIKARVTGFLLEAAYPDGGEVKSEAVLFKIDPRVYVAEFAKAVASEKEAKAQFDKASSEFVRVERLFKTGGQSKEDFEKAKGAFEVAKAGIDGAKAAIEQAQLNVDFTKVTAPFGGRIGRPQADKGSLVRADDTILTKLVDASQVYVDFSVDERSLRRYQIQAATDGKSSRTKPIKELNIRIKIGLEGDSGYPYSGILDFVGVEIDRKTGTYPVRGILDNKDGVFLSGFRARVLVPPPGEKRDRIVITDRAVGSDQGKKFVYVVEDGMAKRRDVVLGRLRPDGLRIISEGLNKDDLVIVNEVQRVRPEMKVVPSVEPMPDAPQKAAN